ncbi:MAG: hypothetical protein JRI86_08325 [Deltaproteobacteria bacterium]|nr:hypothetical protein [Deltaproteobacteria bacterium]
MWKYREKLNYYEKLQRSLYEVMRDALEIHLMKIALIDSFYNCLKNNVDYSFVDKKALKPKSKLMEKESELINTFIVIFCEGSIDPKLKNYIRFFPENKVLKKNVEYLPNFPLYKKFHQNMKYFDQPHFMQLIHDLLNVDYALLIQQDPSTVKKNRYALTHFHVKIDWPIADAAEDLAKWLRYIQNDLYEKGDEAGRHLQNKLFEYYGCHHSIGGRRTAALIASQLLRSQDFVNTVYVSSSESRSMVKYTERGVSKFFLIRLTNNQIKELAKKENMDVGVFKASYLYPAIDYHIGISEAFYGSTKYSKPPEDGKLRKFKPAYNWLKLKYEFLHPRSESQHFSPINYNWIYA